MALDGVITNVVRTEDGVRISIGAREGNMMLSISGELFVPGHSIAGQPTMFIPGATFQPHIGDEIWGGSESVSIESGGISFPYIRDGYTKLIEKWTAK